MAEVVGFGGMSFDLFLFMPRLPRLGETVLADRKETYAGGKAANQVVMAQRLGRSAAMVGRVGADPEGRFVRAELARQGVDVTGVIEDPQDSTFLAVVWVEEGGNNLIAGYPGVGPRLTPEDVRAGFSSHPDCRAALVQSPLRPETLDALLDGGVPVIYNAAPPVPLAPGQAERLALLVANEAEAAGLSGLAVTDVDSAVAAGRRLGLGRVIITLGAQGAVLVEARRAEHVPAFPVRATDTTAAGDAFIGGLAAIWLETGDLIRAMRWGAAAAALTVTRPGSMTALPTRAEVEELLARFP